VIHANGQVQSGLLTKSTFNEMGS